MTNVERRGTLHLTFRHARDGNGVLANVLECAEGCGFSSQDVRYTMRGDVLGTPSFTAIWRYERVSPTTLTPS